MATLTVKNSTYSSTSTSITITFTTDVTPTDVKLTKDGVNWITATSYTSNSATFNISNWGKGTFTNCQLKVSYIEESSGGDTPETSLAITNITGGTFTISNNATITYTTNKAVTKHEYRMDKSYAYTDGSGKVTSSGNNHTMTFNAGELSVGTKNGSIRVTDANGNTTEADFALIINEATQTPDPTPNPPSTGSALDDWDAYNNTYGNYVAYMADRVGVKGKAIRMTATQTPTTVQGSVTKDYRSGSMVSKKAFKYGTFTFKFKVSANDTLLWPMIWTLPDQTVAQDQLIGKNQRPEYDLLESWGALTNNSVVQTYHCTTPAGESKMNYLQGRTPVDLTQEHELKLVWTQDNVVKMYCDGVLKVTIKDYVTNWQTGEVDYQVWFINLGLGGFDGTAPNGVGWFEITDYDFQPVYTRDRVKQDYGFGTFSDGTLPSGPLPSSGGSSGGSGGDTGGDSGGDTGGDTGGDSGTLAITNITVLSSTEANTQINYTTNKAVTTHYFNMWYSGADSGFTDGTAKVTDNGNNNYTMTFANELGAGAKTPAIKVEDANGNTYIKTFDLTVTA